MRCSVGYVGVQLPARGSISSADCPALVTYQPVLCCFRCCSFLLSLLFLPHGNTRESIRGSRSAARLSSRRVPPIARPPLQTHEHQTLTAIPGHHTSPLIATTTDRVRTYSSRPGHLRPARRWGLRHLRCMHIT